ncbi:hypothetical protein B0H14DRAFT_3687879 [Mycena olivaceomarginata]|nr:hypothetical protein B0H14DRAFT_3687879 [Mycena olivaceomarginata]
MIDMTYLVLIFCLYVGFWLAYTIPTIVFILCTLTLLYGRRRFVRPPPTGSVLLTALR